VSATQNRAYDLLLFYQRELADQRKVKFIYINTADNVADLMTKALPEEAFLKHVKNLGMRIRVYATAVRVATVRSKKRYN
jgi:urease gamma subunit